MRRGYDILTRRFRCPGGEVDLVALDGDVLVFVEVRTRRSRRYGEPWESVGWEKRQRLERAAGEFIAHYDLGHYSYRFDIVSVTAAGTPAEEIALLIQAF